MMTSLSRTGRWCSWFIWAMVVWLVLTWSTMAEQLVTGAIIAAVVASGLVATGPVARPWALLRPRAVGAVLRLTATCASRIVLANVQLARRIWHPGRPRASGMVVVPTRMRTEGGVAAVSLLCSLVVDNQVVDVDTRRHLLHVHTIDVEPDPDRRVQDINGPLERHLVTIAGHRP